MRVERVLRAMLRELMFANDIAIKARHGDGNFAAMIKKLQADRTPSAAEAAEDEFFAKQEAEQLNAAMRRAEFIEKEKEALANGQNVQVNRAGPTTGGEITADAQPQEAAPQQAEPMADPVEPAAPEQPAPVETKTTAPPPRASRNR